MEHQDNNQYFRFLIIIIFLVFAGISGFLIYSKIRVSNQPSLFSDSKQTQTQILTPTLLAPSITGGVLSLTVVGDSRHPLTDYLILEVAADSQSIDVVGYDILINFDDQAFELISAESNDPDFTVYKYQSPNKLSVTGAKKINSTSVNLWKNDKILTLTFKPLKTGRFDFVLVNQVGREKTQLVDNQSKVFFPQTNQVMVEIY